MKFKFFKTTFLGLMLSLSGFANAGLIVDNGYDINAVNGPGYTNGNGCCLTWDDFTLTGDAIITSGSFLYRHNFSFAEYNFEIRNNNAGALGTTVYSAVLAAADVAVTATLNSNSIFDFSLPSINLNAGTYWVNFSNVADGSLQGLYGSKVGDFGHTMIQTVNTLSNLRDGVYIPFQLNGTIASVPEPSTLAIFALGMMGLASRRLKKQS